MIYRYVSACCYTNGYMFIAFGVYSQGPVDDGTCPGYETANDCVARKSIFDTTTSYCNWRDDIGCIYEEPEFSWTV